MKYFIGFLLSIVLIVGVFLLVLRGFSGGPKQPKTHTVLSDYANSDVEMQMTSDGPVVADDKHRAIRITIGRSENKIEIIKGYQGEVIKAQTYQNNQQAYDVFLRALQLNGYTKGSPDPVKADERGYCATGTRYIYEIVAGSNQLQRYWTSSCGGGNFGGNSVRIRNLFQTQIPDYNTVTGGVSLSV